MESRGDDLPETEEDFADEGEMDPGDEPEDLFGNGKSGSETPKAQSVKADESLPGLEEAVARVPGDLKKVMEELLRAEFREVIRWKPSR